jgi:hypothetical protein
MIAKKSTTLRTLLWVLFASLLLPFSPAWGSSLNWVVAIKGNGSVVWSTSSPVANGTLVKSGKLTFNQGAFVDLTFQPGTGATIEKVMKNTDDITTWLDGNHHFQFGPVDQAHIIAVIFAGGTPPGAENPTGTFPFVFPTNNLSLIAIADISGTYTGKTPTAAQRSFDFDVAQDQDGKVAIMGTADGIVPKGGGPISGNVGSIKTLNNEPTAQLKGKFEGTRDGAPVSASGSAAGPVEVADIGGGTNGISGTASYAANIAGVPFSAKNVPMSVPTPPTAASRIHKAWSVQLDIQSKVSPKTGKSFIAATAVLTLPNGDVISYPEKAAKYSATKGYSLSFKGGTNTSVQPNAPDKKSTIAIKGMTMVKQGSVWNPTAGTLSYSFLGQKGSGDLMNFVE